MTFIELVQNSVVLSDFYLSDLTLKNLKLENNLSLSIEFDELSKNVYNVIITGQNLVG